MPNATQVITRPADSYLITYRGSLASGEIVTIPDFHQREGDSKRNPLLSLVIQNCSGFTGDFTDIPGLPLDASLSSAAWTQWPRIRVIDDSNDFCSIIAWPNAWQINVSQKLKLQGSNFTGAIPLALFTIMAFYKLPVFDE